MGSGLLFRHKGQAIEYMKNSKKYNLDNVDKIVNLPISRTKAKNRFMGSKKFRNKREKIKFLVKNNYPEKDIENVRSELKLDGWEDHPDLPKNWKMKRTKKCRYLVSESGLLFKGKGQAVEYMKNKYGTVQELR